MNRGAVLIGVKKAGDLPELQAVATGLKRMEDWARSQGIDGERLKILSDEKGAVQAHHIIETIEDLTNLGTLEQLIVYFSGHGIHNRGEQWLLTKAPERSGEAVNVEGSEYLARYCGIPHVVLISDACRTAADSIQALNVTGADIFPNPLGDGLERPVDLFFACARGKPALEVRDPAEAAGGFHALYTEVLAECLRGEHPQILESGTDGGVEVGWVRPWPLEDFLRETVPQRLKLKLGKAPRINQTPDARITSRDGWLSRVRLDAQPTKGARFYDGFGPFPPSPASVTPFSLSEKLVATALSGDSAQWLQVKDGAYRGLDVSLLQASVDKLGASFGPLHFETRCGFKLRGAQASAAYSGGAGVEILDPEGSLIRAAPRQMLGTNVLLVFRNGSGVVLPAIPEFLAEVTFEDDALVDVSYKPAETSPRWDGYLAQGDRLRALRASIAAATSLGIFRLTSDNALDLARQMQMSKCNDPSLAVYAAYAYHDLHRADLIRQMRGFLEPDLGLALFDLVMLSGASAADAGGNVMLPPFPLLSQGWSLLSALRVKMPEPLRTLEQNLLPSLWTLFDPKGMEKLIDAIAAGALK